MTQRDWQKDMEMCQGFLTDQGWSRRDLIAEQPQMSMYWLQEAKERGEREQRLKEEIKEAMPFMREGMRTHFRVIIATLYPDTPAPKEGEDTDWINEETCARCGRNKPVGGYEWCSECRPDLKAKEGE